MPPSALTPAEVDNLVRPLTLKDLRIQTRARGLTPAGGQEALRDRLKADMLSSGDFALKNENGEDQATVTVTAGLTSNDMATGKLQNNYTRAAGQNVGNFLTDRSSSRVLAPPGGVSQISFGDCEPVTKVAPQASANPILAGQEPGSQLGHTNNNYSRPGGQNVGNFLTDRNSSRVLAPPGGASQIHFG